MTLAAAARRVEIRATVENAARDHRLRVVFPLPFSADAADAEGAFEVARRPARPAHLETAAREQWVELPAATQPQKRFVDVSDGARGLALLNRGLPEYELLSELDGKPGSAIALTLLRCVEWLSRPDLTTRRGHAGPMLQTPEAQGIGRHVFEYALVPHTGAWHAEDALVMREAQAFEAPPQALATVQHPGQLPSEWSFVRVEPATVALSAVKRAAREDGVVVRIYNPGDAAQSATLTFAPPFAEKFTEVVAANLDEEPLPEATPLAVEDSRVYCELRPGEIRTLLVRRSGSNALRI